MLQNWIPNKSHNCKILNVVIPKTNPSIAIESRTNQIKVQILCIDFFKRMDATINTLYVKAPWKIASFSF